jgi:transcriptional regulator with XRE-family HTH domain
MTLAQWTTNRIRELCNERRITINKLAEISIITQSTLNSIMHGESECPRILTIYKICAGRITLSDFFKDLEKSDIELM